VTYNLSMTKRGELLDINGNQVVEISNEVAAEILMGIAATDTQPAKAILGKADLIKMVETGQVPKGVRIEGISA